MHGLVIALLEVTSFLKAFVSFSQKTVQFNP
jgi:hypothetical protein